MAIEKWRKFLQQIKHPTSVTFTLFLSILIALPVFFTLYALIPPLILDLSVGIRFDNIFLFIVIVVIFYVLIRKFNKFFFYSFGGGFLALTASSLMGFYSFLNLYHDFAFFIYTTSDKEIDIQFIEESNSFPKREQILNAIDYRNEFVKNQANAWAVANFEKNKNVFPSLKILHAFSIFKEVKSRWKYVFDPVGPDYLSRTSVTISQLQNSPFLTGDCDDYSILLAGLFTAVGCEVQLVLTEVQTPEGKTVGHIYPELKIGNGKMMEKVAYHIKNELFVFESMDKLIYYYIDEENVVWLNMDYNDDYPGGRYQSYLRKSVLKIKE
jgi:uncharacterized protein YkuJ